MSIEDIELDVGGTKFKGIWIAVIFSFASTLGGGIWAASEFFSRLELLEGDVANTVQATEGLSLKLQSDLDDIDWRFDEQFEEWAEDKKSIISDVNVAKQQITDAGIPELQGKLATLGANLQTIMDRQQELLAIQERIIAVEQKVTEMQVTVQKAETSSEKVNDFDQKVAKIEREIEDLWNGLDYLSNPYGGN